MQKTKLFLSVSLFALLTGCATHSEFASETASGGRISQLDKESLSLFKSIDASLAVLAETRNGQVAINETPEEMQKRAWLNRTVPPGMNIPISVNDFYGHPRSILEMLAGMTGYYIEEIGRPSNSVNNVRVSVVSRPAIEVIRSVAYQMGCDGLVDPQGENKKLLIDWSVRRRGECTK
jgi:hypothetical protein